MKSTAPRYIDASKEATAKLCKSFGCGSKMVYYALTYQKDSPLANRIRYTAVKEYGATPMAHYPECETMHDTVEGDRQIMRQIFNNGVTLRIDKNTGEAWATDRKGIEVLRARIVEFTDLAKIQVLAENM